LSLLEQKELEHERSMGAIVALTEKAEELEKRLACSVSSDTELGTLEKHRHRVEELQRQLEGFMLKRCFLLAVKD
jgi:hypothetical protein